MQQIPNADIYAETYDGTTTVSAMVNGYRVVQRYVGYTLKEARRLFRRFVNEGR